MATNDKKPGAASYHGWAGEERREAERRVHTEAAASGKRHDASDRRTRHRCFVCGHTFEPTSSHARVCKPCRLKSLRGGRDKPRGAY